MIHRIWWFGLEVLAYVVMRDEKFDIWSYAIRCRCMNCDHLVGISSEINKKTIVCHMCGADKTHFRSWVGRQFAGKATWVAPELLPMDIRPSELELLAMASKSKYNG